MICPVCTNKMQDKSGKYYLIFNCKFHAYINFSDQQYYFFTFQDRTLRGLQKSNYTAFETPKEKILFECEFIPISVYSPTEEILSLYKRFKDLEFYS